MSDAVAGWYPDPSGDPGRLRYWDGTAWTEHLAPASPPVPVNGGWTGVHDGGAVRPGARAHDGRENPYGAGASPWTSGRGTAEHESGSRTGLVVGLVAGSLLLIAAVAVAAVLLVRGGGGLDPLAPGGGQRDGPVTTGGAVGVGDTVSGSLEAGGRWVATLEVPEVAAVVVDIRTTSDEDLVLEVRGTDEVVSNDDRALALADGSSDWRDPALAVSLPAGQHEIVVSGYDAVASDFTLDVRPVEVIEIGTGLSAEVPAGAAWIAAVRIPAEGTYVFDARASDGDPALSIITPTGEELYSDDSTEGSGDSVDPYLREPLTAGLHVITLIEWNEKPITVELDIVAE